MRLRLGDEIGGLGARLGAGGATQTIDPTWIEWAWPAGAAALAGLIVFAAVRSVVRPARAGWAAAAAALIVLVLAAPFAGGRLSFAETRRLAASAEETVRAALLDPRTAEVRVRLVRHTLEGHVACGEVLAKSARGAYMGMRKYYVADIGPGRRLYIEDEALLFGPFESDATPKDPLSRIATHAYFIKTAFFRDEAFGARYCAGVWD